MQILYFTATTIFVIITSEMRWDQLARLAYGDVAYTPDLLEGNPDFPVFNWLPIGAVVACPIILTAATNAIQAALPPWNQNPS